MIAATAAHAFPFRPPNRRVKLDSRSVWHKAVQLNGSWFPACKRHFQGWVEVFLHGVAPASACQRTVGNCLRLARRGNEEERTDLHGKPVTVATAAACLEGALLKGVVSTLVVVHASFSKAASDGAAVSRHFQKGKRNGVVESG